MSNSPHDEDAVAFEAVVDCLNEIRRKPLARRLSPSELDELATLLSLHVVTDEAGGSGNAVERSRALGRILRSVVDDVIGGRPHPDDQGERREAAEILLYPTGRHEKRTLADRERYIRQHVAKRRQFERRTYGDRLIREIANDLYDRERAVRAGRVEPVTLDLNVALRLDSAGAEAPYERAPEVGQGDVVELATILRLADPVNWKHRAQEFSLLLELSAGPREIRYQARAYALNAVHKPGYTPFDDTWLSVRGAGKIALANLRSFMLQLSKSTALDGFAWDHGRRLPENWLRVVHWEDGSWAIEIRPTSDNTLTADPQDGLKISFLADVYDPDLYPAQF